MSGADFEAASNLIAAQKTAFAELPASVRAQFDNDVAKYLDLMMDDDGPEQLRNMLNPQDEESHEDPAKTPETGSEEPSENGEPVESGVT